jgi:hypothetical protein
MVTAQLEQAWFTRAADGSPVWETHSPGWQPLWTDLLAAQIRRLGPVPALSPPALWVYPLTRTHLVVGQLNPTQGRVLVLTRRLYASITDPFWLAEQFPLAANRAECPTLTLTAGPPERTVDELHHLLKHGNGPLWLGATQVLVDGGRLALARPTGDDAVFRALWQLLPYNTRVEVWLATFAHTNELGFHLVGLPNVSADDPLLAGYWTAESALNYPESPYELRLQQAIEARDADLVAQLLRRRSGRQTLWLALALIVGLTMVGSVLKLLRLR